MSVDKLTKNLVLEALEWDKKENLDKPPSQKSDKHLQDIEKAIASCGVSFNVWEKQDANGKGSGLYDFTSLMGSDKKMVLKSLPQKLKGVIKPETSDTVIQIWEVICAIYKWLLILSNDNDDDDNSNDNKNSNALISCIYIIIIYLLSDA